jgi:hypothetical protein
MKNTAFNFLPKPHYYKCGDHEKSEVGCVEGEGSCENCPNAAQWRIGDGGVMGTIHPDTHSERGTGDTTDNLKGIL